MVWSVNEKEQEGVWIGVLIVEQDTGDDSPTDFPSIEQLNDLKEVRQPKTVLPGGRAVPLSGE